MRSRERGVTYRPNTSVRSLLFGDGGRLRGVRADEGDLTADLVVLATGAWTRPLLGAAGADLPIEAEHHEVAVLRDGTGGPASRLACIDSDTRTYFRPAVGRALAELALGEPQTVDISAFTPDRFAEGKPITPPFGYSDD